MNLSENTDDSLIKIDKISVLLQQVWYLLSFSPSGIARARFSFRSDIPCFCEGDFSEHRSDKLIDKNCKKSDIRNYITLLTKRFCLYCHSEGNARLREEGNAEILNGVFIASGKARRSRGSEIFAEATEDYIGNSN